MKTKENLELSWIDKHSVNCYFCDDLVDERECMPADIYNNYDGGDICPKYQKTCKPINKKYLLPD